MGVGYAPAHVVGHGRDSRGDDLRTAGAVQIDGLVAVVETAQGREQASDFLNGIDVVHDCVPFPFMVGGAGRFL